MTHFIPSATTQLSQYIYQLPIAGLWFIDHKQFSDNRGFYAELGRIPEIDEIRDTPFKIKQLNLSHSKQRVIRGFHAENWNKLLTVTNGAIFAAWADIRPNSPTFGKVVTMEIGLPDTTANTERQWGSVFVSSGIANSFCTLTESADYLYAVDELYANRDTSGDVAISLFDPELAVAWPFPKEELIISDRDKTAVTLQEKFK